jgi:putative restriction endonuclease
MACGLGVTDLRWHSQLLAEPPVGQVNFWTPTLWNLKLPIGTRFGFMLKAPVRKVGGFGHFVRYEELSVEDAWKRWGPANGVRTLEELNARIREFASKRSVLPLPASNPVIGCIVLKDCVFLEERDQFAPQEVGLPFPAPIVKWKRFETDLVIPVERELPIPSAPFSLVGVPDDNWETIRRRKRVAQPLFRRNIIEAYDGRCALTQSDFPEVLEAAHIQPFRGFASHHVQNGIALRRDIHRLFDAGLLTFEADGTVKLAAVLSATSYAGLAGQKAQFPSEQDNRPSLDALKFHQENVFRS